MTEITCLIIEQILAVPKGRVCSYGGIARKAGLPNGARQVVRVLHSMSEKYKLPWHRIIRGDGTIGLTGEGKDLQMALLKAEGVEFKNQRYVDMQKFGVNRPDTL